MVAIGEVAERIWKARELLVLTHDRPDGDAVGSCLALAGVLRSQGRSVTVLMPDGVPYRYSCLAGAEAVKREIERGRAFDVAVVLDTGSIDRIGGGLPPMAAGIGFVVNIDHHATNDGFADLTWCDPSASSAGEMVLALIRDGFQVEPDPQTADALYCAIMTDTGSFRYSNTSPSALKAASYLVERGASPSDLANAIYYSHPLGRMKLLGRVLATLKVLAGGKIAVLEFTESMLEDLGGDMSWTDEFIELARSVAGVEVAVFFKYHEDRVLVSLRSKGKADVAQVAQSFGGGGHPHAAGATLKGMGKAEAMDKVVREVEKVL